MEINWTLEYSASGHSQWRNLRGSFKGCHGNKRSLLSISFNVFQRFRGDYESRNRKSCKQFSKVLHQKYNNVVCFKSKMVTLLRPLWNILINDTDNCEFNSPLFSSMNRVLQSFERLIRVLFYSCNHVAHAMCSAQQSATTLKPLNGTRRAIIVSLKYIAAVRTVLVLAVMWIPI